MSLSVDARSFRDLLACAVPAEVLTGAAGCPLVVVNVDCAAAGGLLAGLDLGALPAVVVVTAADPGYLPAGAVGAADVFLTEDVGGGAWFAGWPGGVAAGVAAMSRALAANPVAGTALALLLRGSATLDVESALVMESATYSALQDGAEFHRWRAARPARPPEPGTARVRTKETDGEVTITLARPARRNAVDSRMRDALAAALAGAVAEPARRVVLRGDGPDFCAGGDLDEFGSRPDPAAAHLIRLARSPALLLYRLGERATAYLHGSCLGAGIELPAFAGRVVAAGDTRIGLPEIGLGLIPGAGGTVSLPRRIGRWRTALLALTGQTIDAEQALHWGLVDAIGAEPET